MSRLTSCLALAGVVVLAGCERNPLEVRRSACPAVAVPAYTGDITLFRPGAAPDAANIDVVATITQLRDVCGEDDSNLVTNVSYQVLARRSDTSGARNVALPVFATVVQGGNLIVSKQVGSVTVSFADGQARAQAAGGTRATVARSAAVLPAEIQKKIGRKRQAGDLDAATDPMAEPEVRAAMRAATFEVLVGFQLDETKLAYNVAK